MKKLMTFVVAERSEIQTDHFTFRNNLHMPVNVTVDAFDSLVERQALEIMDLKDKLSKFE